MPERPDEPLRPNDAYEVRARIRPDGGRGGRILAALVVVGLVGWGAYLVAGRGASSSAIGSPGPSGLVSSSGPTGTFEPVASGPVGTEPPPVSILRTDIRTAPLPVILDGLEYLDPSKGVATHAGGTDRPEASAGWWFQLSSTDSVCACLLTGLASDPATLVVERFSSDGRLVTSTGYPGFAPPPSTTSAADVVLDHRATSIVTGVIQADPTTWRLHLRQIPLYVGGPSADRWYDLGVLEQLALPELTGLRLFLTPDDQQLLVSFGDPSISGPGNAAQWLIPVTKTGLGGARANPFGRPDATTICGQATWASNTVFANICGPNDGPKPGNAVWTVELERLGPHPSWLASPDWIPLDLPGSDASWIVDSTNGHVYGWAAVNHEIARVDAADGGWQTLQLGLPFPNGQTLGGPLPQPAASVAWSATLSASQPFFSTLAGSADGTLLYAIGDVVDLFGRPVADGIWVIDAGSLAFLREWSPAGDYGALGLTPDGHQLVAVGVPLPEDAGSTAAFDSMLAIHALSDGSVVAIDRDLGSRLGGSPQLLWPAPPED